MGRNTALTPDDLAQLPGACAGCLRWERFCDGSGLPWRPGLDDAVAAKRGWWVQRLSAGTGGGVVVRSAGHNGDRAVAGYATYAVPDRGGGDALTVLGLHVDAGCRGVGLGRALAQAVAREALRRPRIRAVEALAGLPKLRVPGSPGCLVPVDFWLACGFTVVRPHPLTPTVRLDARMLAPWRTGVEDAVEQAWERLRGAVRPDPPPRPALSGQRVRRG